MLDPSFFARDPRVVARELLGVRLALRAPDGSLRSGVIVETEAYLGEEDLASHARAGLTTRTAPMFGPPGRAYVYLCYGVHEMFNVTTLPEGEPSAVLIRALDPGPGVTRATHGPGRLTKALGITRAHNSLSLQGPLLTLHRAHVVDAHDVGNSPRIGVEFAGEWADRPWRFFDSRSTHLSQRTPRRSQG